MIEPDVMTLVATLLAHYPQAQFTKASAQAYEHALVDLEFEICQLAIARLVKSSRFLPTIAEIRAAALDVQYGPRRRGSEAWGDVVEAIRRVGAYRPSPEFPDPTVSECVRQMGWRNLCLGDNEAADRARFIALYDELGERARVDCATGHSLPPARSYAALVPGAREITPDLLGAKR